MLAEFIVTFREFFEIALIVGIMLAYLQKTGNAKFAGHVWLGAGLAALASIVPVLAFGEFAEMFEQNEELFEGITLVVAAALVTWFMLWMIAQRNVAEGVRKGLRVEVEKGQALGIVLFSFMAVFREGVEIVLFLGGISMATGTVNMLGAVAGIFAALLLAYAVFRGMMRLDFGAFFSATSFVLILLAAGLLSQGVHGLQEAKVLPFLEQKAYDVTPALNADGSYPLMHEKGAVGGVLKGIVGYDTAPSLLQVLAYAAYLALAAFAWLRFSKPG